MTSLCPTHGDPRDTNLDRPAPVVAAMPRGHATTICLCRQTVDHGGKGELVVGGRATYSFGAYGFGR